MKSIDNVFPIYTNISSDPQTICMQVDPNVFKYPFFNQGVNEIGGKFEPYDKFSLKELENLNYPHQLEIKGLIFHSSHCGSTLISRLLNSYDEVRVVSESEAINGLLLSYCLYEIAEEKILDQLNSIINAYRHTIGREKYLIFKLTSWNVWFLELFQSLYPQTNWIFLDRNSDEIVKSLKKSNGGMENWWHHKGNNLKNYFVGKDFDCRTKQDYLRRLVDRHKEMAKKHENEYLLNLSYPEFLVETETINSHFGLKITKEEYNKSKELLNYNSKSMNNIKFNML